MIAVNSDRAIQAPRRPHARRAFTLIEMMIVIGIVLLLTALTVTVTITFTMRSEINATENLLKQLDVTMSEWEHAAGRTVTFGIMAPESEPCDIDPADPAPEHPYSVYDVEQIQGANHVWDEEDLAVDDAHHVTDDIWRVIGRSTVWREFIASVDPELMEVHEEEDEPDAYHFLDAWGTQILAIHPGRAFERGCDDRAIIGYVRDNDDTIRTPYEQRFGIAAGRRMYFVSAGPDGRFGDLTADADTAEYEQTQDNLYSYEVIKP